MLVLNNDHVAHVLTMKDTMEALERSYLLLVDRKAVCRPRIDLQIPTEEPGKVYQWGTMEGGASDYFAIRMKSDIMYQQEYAGVTTQEKYCVQPGLYCGLILLFRTDNAEPVALMNDGFLQHMRVGADAGIGAKYIAREDAATIGMLGSGGMARTYVESILRVRPIKKVKVYSPTPANREAYAQELGENFGLDVEVVDNPRLVHQGVDILADCTDSASAVIHGEWVEPGTHLLSVGGGYDPNAVSKIDLSLRLGNAPSPVGMEDMGLEDELITYVASGLENEATPTRKRRGHGARGGDRTIYLGDLLSGAARGRTSPDQVTQSERGNVQGAQFYAVAGRVYELAKQQGIGNNFPTEWLLQDIRD